MNGRGRDARVAASFPRGTALAIAKRLINARRARALGLNGVGWVPTSSRERRWMEHERSAARRSSWEQTMRDDWDERVRGDLRYICWNDDGWNTDGDLGAFYEEGKAHAITLTSPALERSSFRA